MHRWALDVLHRADGQLPVLLAKFKTELTQDRVNGR
jgi:hypothetical protein